MATVGEARARHELMIAGLEERVRLLERACASMYLILCRQVGVPLDATLDEAIREEKAIRVVFKKNAKGQAVLVFEPDDKVQSEP